MNVHTSQIKSMFKKFRPITSFSYPNYLIMALDGTNPTKSKTQTRMDSRTLFCGQDNQITYLWRCSKQNCTTTWFSVYLIPRCWELNQHDPLDSHDARGWWRDSSIVCKVWGFTDLKKDRFWRIPVPYATKFGLRMLDVKWDIMI